MYHDNHPDKDYEMANRVEVFDRPRAIAWQPAAPEAHPTTPISNMVAGPGATISNRSGPSETEVTLTYDWSAVPPFFASTFSFRRSTRNTWTTR